MVNRDKDIVTACLLIIGDEILSGRTQDRNLSHLAVRLNECGVQLKHARVISDDEAVIIASVNELRVSYDYVFTTGGIGPTHDDITSRSIARAFGVGWEVHPEAHALLSSHYEGLGVEFNEHRLKMAKLPIGSVLLANPLSIAPGFCLENVFVLAGVPAIMEVMLDSALGMLSGGLVVHSRSISCDLGEGTIAQALCDLQEEYSDISIGSYPIFGKGSGSKGGFGLHVVMRGSDIVRVEELCDRLFVVISDMGGNPVRVEVD